mmetsp:Transcript_77007/g.214121  ORF Transcript_77007/g.214121 Transcript_77007/m.214121 type:complete len:224 (+) Transcript_77007:327-998(+)
MHHRGAQDRYEHDHGRRHWLFYHCELPLLLARHGAGDEGPQDGQRWHVLPGTRVFVDGRPWYDGRCCGAEHSVWYAAVELPEIGSSAAECEHGPRGGEQACLDVAHRAPVCFLHRLIFSGDNWHGELRRGDRGEARRLCSRGRRVPQRRDCDVRWLRLLPDLLRFRRGLSERVDDDCFRRVREVHGQERARFPLRDTSRAGLLRRALVVRRQRVPDRRRLTRG